MPLFFFVANMLFNRLICHTVLTNTKQRVANKQASLAGRQLNSLSLIKNYIFIRSSDKTKRLDQSNGHTKYRIWLVYKFNKINKSDKNPVRETRMKYWFINHLSPSYVPCCRCQCALASPARYTNPYHVACDLRFIPCLLACLLPACLPLAVCSCVDGRKKFESDMFLCKWNSFGDIEILNKPK